MLLKNKISEIKNLVEKSDNILISKEECYCYAEDASNFPDSTTIPEAVIFATSTEEVQRIVKYANENKIPVITRGAGTNMVGACVCKNGGIVLNFSKMNKILKIDEVSMTARVQAGAVLGDLKSEAEKFGLFFPPDPSNYRVSTVGGAIAQSSGGALSFKYGTTKDYVLSLKVVTANGDLITFGAETTKDSAGYHLAQLMVGSEGTLGIVTEAVLRLIPKPQTANVIVAYFNNIKDAVSAIDKITSNGISPSAVEFMDKNAVITIEEYAHCKFKTIYDCVILLEIDGDECSVSSQIERSLPILKQCCAAKVYVPPSKDDYDRVWRARRSSYAAASRIAPDVISDDIIVPRKNLAEMVERCNEISKKYNIKICLVGHIGDGNLHPQFVLNADSEIEFQNYMNAKSEMYSAAISLGGTISAEHGIGTEKMGYLNNVVDQRAIEYMKAIKKVFDPNNILNPDKIFKLDKE